MTIQRYRTDDIDSPEECETGEYVLFIDHEVYRDDAVAEATTAVTAELTDALETLYRHLSNPAWEGHGWRTPIAVAVGGWVGERLVQLGRFEKREQAELMYRPIKPQNSGSERNAK